MQSEITQYIAALDRIFQSGNATEHSYRPALQRLLESTLPELTVTNEPKRIACGAPDYIIMRNDIPAGYVEAKDIGTDLNNKAHKEQFDRYKSSLGNLIITDYLTFQYWKNGELSESVTLAELTDNEIKPIKKVFAAFKQLLDRFAGYEGLTVANSDDLAKHLAAKAKLLADCIERSFAGLSFNDLEDSEDSLVLELKSFRDVLIPSMSFREFADVYAQTIAYGLFSARIHDKPAQKFSRKKAAELIPASNQFLRKFFQTVAGYDIDRRIEWMTDDLADLLNHADMREILKDFGQKGHDPMLHFYETFLAEYDPALRKSRGVWYTPFEIVEFIVRIVDDLLQSEFGLEQGLATSNFLSPKEKALRQKKNNKEVKEEKVYHTVQILDPATGTGTFLAEVIRRVYERYKSQPGLWQVYVSQHLIPRLHGFEIMMAAHAVTHTKLDLTLQNTGYQPDTANRLNVYLTNSLEEAGRHVTLPGAKWLSDEINAAIDVKKEIPIMVVLGNPPYSGESQNKNKWIERLLQDYKYEPTGERLKERNAKWINDDYVKFIRFGQHLIEQNSEGILAYITNHGFLDNPTFRGMRWNLLNTFDKIYVLDLHGNTRKQEIVPDGKKDENVFDIQQGVSINIFIKTGKKEKGELAEVFHYGIFGEREKKYAFLENNTLQTIRWNRIEHKGPLYFFVPKPKKGKRVYEKGFSVTELFPLYGTGIVTKRDSLSIHLNAKDAFRAAKDIVTLEKADFYEKYALPKDVRDWQYDWAVQDIKESKLDKSLVKPIYYRPFDVRYLYYTGRSRGFVGWPVPNIMSHFLNGENVGLISIRRSRKQQMWNFAFVSDCIVSGSTAVSSLDINYVFPLYLYQESALNGKTQERTPNLNSNVIDNIGERIGLSFDPDGAPQNHNRRTAKTFTPLDVLDYIYAVLYSPDYRTRYQEFLKIDFPRIPYPESAEEFWRLAGFGCRLRRLHLMHDVEPLPSLAAYPVPGTNLVESLRYQNEKVWINATQYFDNVPLGVWEFYIGGYQPTQKWLKDRKGRTLNYDEVLHYQKIICVLKETIEIMGEIDKVLLGQ